MSLIANGLIKFDDYQIDRARWQLSWRDEPLPLNRKTFDLLLYLTEHAGRVISKDELLRALWAESFVEESNLTQHIFLLRKALSRHASGAKIIETVPGRGYRFAAAIVTDPSQTIDRMVISASETITRITFEEESEEVQPTGSALANGGTRALGTARPLSHRSYWITGSLVVLILICVASWVGWQRWLDHTGGPPVQLVITPMEGTTGDTVLDQALTEALAPIWHRVLLCPSCPYPLFAQR